MKCLHCLVEFHDNKKQIHIDEDADGGWAIFRYDCPACKRMNLFLVNGTRVYAQHVGWGIAKAISETPIRPKGSGRLPCPPEVPTHIASDYSESCLVLSVSPKASAALSRRCLQNLLRDVARIKHGNLADEIQETIDSKQLPTHIIQVIDAVRQIGNFAAHPVKSKNTGEILPVEPHEAEWNLDVLESLFDFYYVQPAIIARKKASLNAKLQEAGKASMK
ncbi:hypothetical protein ANAEL_03706 [Anaerolineales bacterium]|nr:hypothetical protein ANAEL_03706 [Anaerolineales bacterium]